jgi:hypothetical protein
MSDDGGASGSRLALPLTAGQDVVGLLGLVGPGMDDLSLDRSQLLDRLVSLAGAAASRAVRSHT